MVAGLELQGLSPAAGAFSLAQISLSITPEEYFVITGANGTGKTVLLKTIAGLLPPAAGRIMVQGRDITDLPPWQRAIGYVPQDGVLFPNRTVRRNIAFGLEVRKVHAEQIKTKVETAAAMLGIEALLERMPEGLSGGEKQKAAIARALVIEPDLLLLDEPVSSLDEETRDAICAELKKLHQEYKITTIHVAHNSREIELVADRVGIIAEGELRVR